MLASFKTGPPLTILSGIPSTIFEQVNTFNYLGYNVTYKGQIEIEMKLEKFYTALRIIKQVFHPAKVRKHTRLSAYKTLARPVLTYGREARIVRKQDEQTLTTAEMKFMRRPYEKRTHSR
jgi:hypothetical protein